MERITRRNFLQGATVLAAGLTLPGQDLPWQLTRQINSKDILGLHDVPTPGASRDVPMLRRDLNNLGINRAGHTLVCVDPSPEVISTALSMGLRIIARPAQEENKFDEENLRLTMSKLRVAPNTLIVPFNEPNHDEPIQTPAEHVENFLEASELILEEGGRPMLTPLCPYARAFGLSEDEYFQQMVDGIIRQRSVNWFVENLDQAAHIYIYTNGHNPWDRVARQSNYLVQRTGVRPPIEVTEAGVEIPGNRQRDDAWIADQLVRLIETPIPDDLQRSVRSVCIWLYANRAQRPEDEQEIDSEEMASFEISSLVRLTGPTESYRQVSRLMNGYVSLR